MVPINPYTGIGCVGGQQSTVGIGTPNASCSYKLPICNDCIAAYPDGYAGGVPNTMTLEQLQTAGVGARLWHGSTKHNTALYSTDQTGISATKIQKVIK